MQPRPEASACQLRLIDDVQSMLAWRGILSIIADYKSAASPADKSIKAIDAMLFILDRVEGEQAAPRLRNILQLAQSDLRTSQFAKEIAKLVFETAG